MIIPEFFRRYKATRFRTHALRGYANRLSMYDYLAAVQSTAPRAATKDTAPAWALCNDTGDNTGAPNGVVQLDFDAVEDVTALRRALIDYGGLLAVHTSFGGHGLVALGYVGKRLAADPEKVESLVYAPLRLYLRSCGIADGAYTLDTSCAKSCQLRYESRDPDLWAASEPAVLYADPEDDDALTWHPVAALAEALCPSAGVTPAGLAAALVCISMAANLRSRMTPQSGAYAARAFCVIVGEPGSGKTTLLNAVQDTAQSLGIIVSDPKNAPTLREHILACGCDEVLDPPQPGERGAGKKRLVERADRDADPLVVCVDEAGQRLRTRVADESCGSLAAMLRQCNGERITLESTVKQEHRGSYRVPAHVSVLLGTTLPQWAEYAAFSKQENGEARRVAEFIQPVAPRDIFLDSPASPDVPAIVAALAKLRDMAELWADSDVIFAPAANARAAFRSACTWLGAFGLDSPSAQSLVMCYSTLCAGLRASSGGPRCIQAADLAACMVILRHVTAAREVLATESERAGQSAPRTEGTVWAEILGWIEKTPRRDKILAKIARRPPQYRRVYGEMLAAKAIVAVRDGSRYVLRPASPEELEAAEERKATPTPLAAGLTATASAYADCSTAEREERLLAYYAQFRADNGIAEGNRNNAFARLAYLLQKSGMWDDVARDFVAGQARNAGLNDAEVRKIIRERKNLEKS